MIQEILLSLASAQLIFNSSLIPELGLISSWFRNILKIRLQCVNIR